MSDKIPMVTPQTTENDLEALNVKKTDQKPSPPVVASNVENSSHSDVITKEEECEEYVPSAFQSIESEIMCKDEASTPVEVNLVANTEQTTPLNSFLIMEKGMEAKLAAFLVKSLVDYGVDATSAHNDVTLIMEEMKSDTENKTDAIVPSPIIVPEEVKEANPSMKPYLVVEAGMEAKLTAILVDLLVSIGVDATAALKDLGVLFNEMKEVTGDQGGDAADVPGDDPMLLTYMYKLVDVGSPDPKTDTTVSVDQVMTAHQLRAMGNILVSGRATDPNPLPGIRTLASHDPLNGVFMIKYSREPLFRQVQSALHDHFGTIWAEKMRYSLYFGEIFSATNPQLLGLVFKEFDPFVKELHPFDTLSSDIHSAMHLTRNVVRAYDAVLMRAQEEADATAKVLSAQLLAGELD